MPKTLTVANWKMYGNRQMWQALSSGLAKEMAGVNTQMVLATPAAAYFDVEKAISGVSNISLSAQDVRPEDEGAYTGDNNAIMAKDFGAEYTLIGHSERRTYHGEREELLNAKSKQALSHGLKVIYCVGESLAERQSGKTLEVLAHQIGEGLKGIQIQSGEEVAIAYEPVWAISSSEGSLGREPNDDELQEVFQFMGEKAVELFGESAGKNVALLYGGSVKPENIEKIMAHRPISGVLVGGASLKVDSFMAIANGVAAKQV